MKKIPWMPIAGLPCAPNPDREFLITGCPDDASSVVRWDSVRGYWKARDEGLYDKYVRSDFSHFIEVIRP